MKTLVILTYALLLFALLTLSGCSNVDVEAQSGDQSAHERLVNGEEEENPLITSRAKVDYLPPAEFPAEAPQPGLNGLIMIRVLVGVDGNPVEANVSQSLHPDLDQAALDAALKGKYLPAREGEIPREMWISVPFRYPAPEKEE
jgi:TonB family protein